MKAVSSPRPLQAAAVLSVLYLLARLTGLVQQSIINSHLPLWANDAYSAAFTLPDYINYLVAGGAMSVTFIPIFTQLLHNGREKEAWRFFSTLATVMGCVLLLLTAGAMIATRPLVYLAAPGLTDPERPAETFEMAVAMTRVILPAQIFFYLGGMIVGVLNAHKHFGASGWTGAVYNVVAIIVALLLLGTSGPLAFAWGILIGAFVGNFLLPLGAALTGPREQRLHYRFNLNWRQPSVRRFFRNALPIMLGVSFPVVDQLIVTLFGSLLPEGSMAYLRSGNRAMIAAQGVVAQAASVAAFPYLAADSAAGEWLKFSEFLRTGLRRLLFLTLPLATLMILTAKPIISLLFGYGNWAPASGAAYSPQVSETAVAFAFYCIGLFAWAGQQLVARGFYALQDTLTPTVIGSIITVFFIGVSYVAALWGGVLGLAFVTSVGGAVHFTWILIRLDSKLRQQRYNAPIHVERIMGTLLRTMAACVLMGLAGLLANAVASFLPPGKASDMVRIVWISAVAGVTFALAAQRFDIPEWHWIKSKLLRRKRR